MAPRIQSPSSINYYKMCPRCYYYRYIKKVQLPGSIHLLRGNLVHNALEDFFKVGITSIHKEHYEMELNIILQSLFKTKWDEAKSELDELGLNEKQQQFYFQESVNMINNWFARLISRVNRRAERTNLEESFNTFKPLTEEYYESKTHMVRGYIDAIEHIEGATTLIDYKTSKRDHMSEEYKLQLAIYALMYEDKHGTKPASVGIDFLRHGIRYLEVNQELVDHAVKECKLIQEKTQTENIEDYQKSGHIFCECSKYEEILEKTTLDQFQ
jgi:CRISPR/Cas system-associated exonuclease Cas4 (RecB family)